MSKRAFRTANDLRRYNRAVQYRSNLDDFYVGEPLTDLEVREELNGITTRQWQVRLKRD